MFHRSLNLPEDKHYFLFGARGTGKSSLLRARLPEASTRTYDLLDLDLEDRLARNPQALVQEVLALPPSVTHVVVDEVQKLPRLLDAVHALIESHRVPQRFVLTGSSARKLKAGGANLLGGRAWLRQLFPLQRDELGEAWDEDRALRFGGLPAIWNAADDGDRMEYLRAYALAYLKEEIQAEQVVRNLEPFRRFLEVAAQTSGKVLNHARIAREAGTDPKTVQAWYAVLEDTHLGFRVDGYHSSVRKQLRQAPKFYLFDTGVTRALARLLQVPPQPGTSYFGEVFEGMVVASLFARNAYEQLEWRFNHLQTKAGLEVDLVLDRPGRPLALVEIKSTDRVRQDHAAALHALLPDFPGAEGLLLSRDPAPQRLGRVLALPWWEGVGRL